MIRHCQRASWLKHQQLTSNEVCPKVWYHPAVLVNRHCSFIIILMIKRTSRYVSIEYRPRHFSWVAFFSFRSSNIIITGHYRFFTHCFQHMFYNWRIKNQLDVTCYFIVLLIGSTCFGHYCAHHKELATIMLITTLVVSFSVCCMLEVRCG